MKILGICGSLRSTSKNMGLLKVAQELAPKAGMTLDIASLHDLPLYNGDTEVAGIPASVNRIAQQVKEADGVLFSLPEYNYSLSPEAKNVIDWISRTPGGLWDGKPVAVMGAGGGCNATQSIFHLLRSSIFLGMRVMNTQVHANAFSPTFTSTGSVAPDAPERGGIEVLLKELREWCAVNQKPLEELKAGSGKLRVLGISGSLRTASTNTGLLRVASASLPNDIEMEIADIASLPVFDAFHVMPSSAPPAVLQFLRKVAAADAIVFGCPEYNFGLTGPLVNALAWGGAFNAFKGKAALVLGSGGGMGAARSLLHLRQSFTALDLHFTPGPRVCIPAFEPGNFDLSTGNLVSEKWAERVQEAMVRLRDWTHRTKAFQADRAWSEPEEGQAEDEPPPPPAGGETEWASGKTRILVVPGTASRRTPAFALAEAVAAVSADGADVKLVRGGIAGIPLYNQDTKEASPAVLSLSAQIAEADAVIFTVPEACYSAPPGLKNAVDWVSKQPQPAFKGKVVGFVGVGRWRSVHAQNELRQSALFLGFHSVNVVAGAQPQDFGEDGALTNADVVPKLEKHVAAVAALSRRVSDPSPSPPPRPVNLLVVPGSLRKASANLGLCRAAMEAAPRVNDVHLTMADIADIPPYNQDVEAKGYPPSVLAFCEALQKADGILFVCPEYNYGMTPLLKNAVDWASRRKAFDGKPAAVIGTGGDTGSTRGQYVLRQVAVFLNMHLLFEPTVAVREFNQGVTDLATGDLLDPNQKSKIQDMLTALRDWSVRFL